MPKPRSGRDRRAHSPAVGLTAAGSESPAPSAEGDSSPSGSSSTAAGASLLTPGAPDDEPILQPAEAGRVRVGGGGWATWLRGCVAGCG